MSVTNFKDGDGLVGKMTNLGWAGKHLELKVGGQHLDEFEKALNGYLNTRPDAPRWLFELADVINPIVEIKP